MSSYHATPCTKLLGHCRSLPDGLIIEPYFTETGCSFRFAIVSILSQSHVGDRHLAASYGRLVDRGHRPQPMNS